MADCPGAKEGRYSRNCDAISADEQQKLARCRVAVAGCGGLGGFVIEQLARVGVGTIVCIDCDAFDATNLNRQLLCTEDNLGRSKAQAAVERVRAINAAVTAEACDLRLSPENAADVIRGCQCVVDCLDTHAARFHLSQACLHEGIPLVFGAIAGWYGQVATVFPGDVIYATVYGDPEPDDDAPHISLGNLPFTCAATAAFQAAECVKVLLGRDVARNSILMLDLESGTTDRL